MNPKRNCTTCKWEPVWASFKNFNWDKQESVTLHGGKCRFAVSGLPRGARITSPHVCREDMPRNCPAWMQKEEKQ